MPLRPRAAIVGALLALGGPGVAVAARLTAVAPLEGLGIGEAEVGRVQRWVEAAVSGVAGHRLVGASRLPRLVRQQADARACLIEARCLASLARAVGAERIVAGEVGSIRGAFAVYLRLVDSGGRPLRTASGVLDPGARLRETARELATQLLAPERHTGALVVRVDVADAWVYLDGRRVGRGGPATVHHVPVGPHALRVTHEAYRDFVRFVDVGFEQTANIPVTLSAFPVRGGEMRLLDPGAARRPLADRELPWYRRWWAVTAFGAVVLGATTASVAVLIRRSVARDAEVVVRPP